MIMVVEGEGPGAGKSYYVCHYCIQHFLKGGIVYAVDTFELLWDNLKTEVARRFHVVLDDSQYQTFPESDVKRLHEVTPPGSEALPVLVVVDEAHDELNARDHADKGKRPMFKWLTQSRHDDTDVIFISQDKDNMDGQIRRLANIVVVGEDMGRRYVPFIGFWMKNRFQYHFQSKNGSQIQPSKLMEKQGWIFNCYRSKAMRMRNKRLGEPLQPVKLSKVERKPMFKTRALAIIAIVVVGLALFYGWRTYNNFRSLRHPRSENGSAVTSPNVANATPGSPKSVEYDISTETFRGTDERTWLLTDQGEYRKGTMSQRGFVTGVQGRVVLVTQPDGKKLYIVSSEKAATPVNAARPGAPKVVGTPIPKIQIADWKPHDSTLANEAEAAQQAFLKK